MSTSTNRLALIKPDKLESMPLGANQLATNWNNIDSNIGISSGTVFPAAPFTGKMFNRSDQNLSYYWNGTAWIIMGGIQTPGAKGMTNGDYFISSPQLSANLTEVKIQSVVFNAIQNRSYCIKLAYHSEFIEAVAGYALAVTRWAPGATVLNTDTMVRSFRYYMDCTGVAGKNMNSFFNFFYSGISQQISIGLFMKTESGTINVKSGANPESPAGNTIVPQTSLIVMDWG